MDSSSTAVRPELDLGRRVSLREDPRILAALEDRAHAAGRTLSDEIRAALRQRLAEAKQ
jgi:uncharacterized membrane protein